MQAVSETLTPATLAIVQELAPAIRDALEDMDRERRLPARLAQAMAEAGIFRLGIPKRLGGNEADPATIVRTIEELSVIDGSVGWCAMISALYGVFAGCLQTDAAREIYGSDPHVITAGTFRPNGEAVSAESGYRLTGRWPFASHCQNASWLVGGARIFDGDQPRLGSDGSAVWRLFFFPAADCLIIDTWQTAGLRGTGSHDFTVADLFVPAARSISFREPPVEPGPLYALPLIAFFATGIAAVPLGIARHAIEILEELAGAKKPTWSQNLLREQPLAQAQVGQAHALVRAGRALVYDTLAEAWRTVRAGGHLSLEQRAWLWLAATQASVMASQAVDLMFTARGATSVYASAGLERCLRDVRTAAQHVTVISNNYRTVGQAFLGLDVSATQLSIDDRGDW
ncbi:MAG TPA: acyl-CoA dehydrogenase family protein [Chloroflexota bacterium]|nr:acyl-CoA dehydrogenase family protein [Chloroflexota bacterium]